MYIYKVYDFNYDDTSFFQLTHKTKFTKEEYENIVNKCLMKIREKIERNEKILENSEVESMSDEEIEKLELWTCSGEWDIYRNLHKMMINEYGFEELEKPLYTFVLRGGFYGEGQIEENRVID